jgi:hypothetical protein
MKSKAPNTSQFNHKCARVTRRARAVSAAVAAALLCLSVIPFAGAASPDGPRQKNSNPPAPAPAQTPAPTQTPAPPQPPATSSTRAGQRVKLYYLRQGTKIAAALTAIAQPNTSPLHGLAVNIIDEDELILVGEKEKRRLAGRLIATLDLPRPGVQMEMWGVQISSRRPEDLAEVMRRVRREIDRTQQDVRDTFAMLQEFARDIRDEDLDPDFKRLLQHQDFLYYESALNPNRPLSLSDILLRFVAAKEPVREVQGVANKLDRWLGVLRSRREAAGREDEESAPRPCTSKSQTARAKAAKPRTRFDHFFRNRGLEYRNGTGWVPVANPDGGRDYARENALVGRTVLLDFALHYAQLIHDPESFDPYDLQQSAGVLNTRLQTAIDALNQDVQDVFVAPTLDRIRLIVAEFCDVDYAQVGKTTVASLSGAQSVVSTESVNMFEFIKPLNLSDFLTRAKALTDLAKPLDPGPATTNKLGTIPFTEVIGLIGALGEDRTVNRETKSGVSLTITPDVLRNMTSAELNINLKTGDPMASGTQAAGTPQLTRVSKHEVATKVYVNALDFFDLSAFGSQATMNGGRGYVPIIGPLWRGLFGEAPVIGQFLSWKKKPQTVYSQSLVLTTSFITPTAMGVALLVPTERAVGSTNCADRFRNLQREIKDYGIGLFNPRVRQQVGNPCPENAPRIQAAQ